MWICGSEILCLQQEIFLLKLLFKFKYYGTFAYITQIIHPDAHLNHLKGILSDKPLKSLEI